MRQMMQAVGLFLVAMIGVGCSGGGNSNVSFKPETFTYNGEARNYAVYTPPNYNPSVKYPAVLFLHGLFEGGNNGTSPTKVGIGPAIKENPERWKCIVIMAQTSSNWQKDGSVELAAATLDDAARKYNIDQNSVVATGLSNGGAGVWLLGAKYPGKFAGLAPLCAYAEEDTIPKLTTVPIWAFHNSMDPFVFPSGTRTMVEKINQAGGNAQITIYGAFGHDCWDTAYADEKVVSWLQSQRRR